MNIDKNNVVICKKEIIHSEGKWYKPTLLFWYENANLINQYKKNIENSNKVTQISKGNEKKIKIHTFVYIYAMRTLEFAPFLEFSMNQGVRGKYSINVR